MRHFQDRRAIIGQPHPHRAAPHRRDSRGHIRQQAGDPRRPTDRRRRRPNRTTDWPPTSTRSGPVIAATPRAWNTRLIARPSATISETQGQTRQPQTKNRDPLCRIAILGYTGTDADRDPDLRQAPTC